MSLFIRSFNFIEFLEWRPAEKHHIEALKSFLNSPQNPINRPIYINIDDNESYIARITDHYLYIDINNNQYELKYI
jgi:hypothetical protein